MVWNAWSCMKQAATILNDRRFTAQPLPKWTKLGFGGYSTIWLARDKLLECYLAVKIGILHSSFPRREGHILRQLSGAQQRSEAQATRAAPKTDAFVPLLRILESFEINGPN